MGAGSGIIVERDAKLIIDGGIITNACPDMWQGIEVWGIPGNVIDNNLQGWVIMKNHALVENAKLGVGTFRTENQAILFDHTGGIVQADSSTFRNNIYDVQIINIPDQLSLGSVSFSRFSHCNFITDSSFYFFTPTPTTHVYLSQTSRINFKGNTFENTCSLGFAPENKRGNGIASYNSSFSVVPDDITAETNYFNALEYGIQLFDFGLTIVEVQSAEFNHNQTGVYAGGNILGAFNLNTFDVTNKTESGSEIRAGAPYYGLYLDACTGYQVQENDFSSNYDSQSLNEIISFGLVVNNSGPEDNFIYNNDFVGLKYATHAQGINRGNKGETGLTIKCNDYQNNYQDIAVIPFGQGDQEGVKHFQGSSSSNADAPAGNTFSNVNNPTNPFRDFSNSSSDIIYWYHLPSSALPLIVLPEHSTPPPKVFPRINIENPPIYDKTYSCPSIPENLSKTLILTDIATNKSSEEIYSDSLEFLIDDGNTAALSLDVSVSIPPETMELRDELLSASPYLSDTVMVNAAEKEDVLPNSIIAEVLTANPQSARAKKVLKALDERDNPPNENQMASIHANDTVIGHKESLESKQAYFAGKKASSVYELARLFMHDTTDLSIHDSIAAVLTNIPTTTSRYFQAFCNLNSSDSLGVLNVLNNIPSEFDLDDAETDYHAYFNDYFDVFLELQTQEKYTKEIDSAQKASLYDIMNNTGGLLHAYARNLLIYTDGLVYHEPYLLPDTSSNKSIAVTEDIYSRIWDKENYFTLYPNPANGYITLEYQLDYGISDPVVEVISIDGVHLNTFRLFNRSGIKIIDLRDWKKGTYILRMLENGKTLQSEKFIKY